MRLSFHTNHRMLLVAPALTFAALTVAIAVAPAAVENRSHPGDVQADPPPDVARGRALYVAEGCSYCHTQLVRQDMRKPAGPDGARPALEADARYGRPTTPDDYAADDPPLLGTQRTGPDLQDVGGRLPSPEWHYTHLYDPRAVVPDSIMPSYRWYFGHERKPGWRLVVLPTQAAEELGRGVEVWASPDAQALVAYLLSLKTGAVR